MMTGIGRLAIGLERLRQRIAHGTTVATNTALVEDQAIVELVGPIGAPLRAWVVNDRAVPPGTVPLDALGRRVLGVDAGAALHVRPL